MGWQAVRVRPGFDACLAMQVGMRKARCDASKEQGKYLDESACRSSIWSNDGSARS